MDVLTAILACSLHPDDELVRALVEVASRGNVYFVGDLVTLKTNDDVASLKEAERAIAKIERDRGRPAVGLMGIPISWAARFERSPVDLFDGCTNVAIATAVLSAHDHQCRTRVQSLPKKQRIRRTGSPSYERSRACVLRGYGLDMDIAGFAEAVLKNLAQQRAPRTAAPTGGDAAPERSPVFVDYSAAPQNTPSESIVSHP